MKIYNSLSQIQSEKLSYYQLAFSTGARINFQLNDDYITLIPIKLGNNTVVVEIAKSEEDTIKSVAEEEYIFKNIITTFRYNNEILELENKFKKTSEKNFFVGLFQKKENFDVIFQKNFGIIETAEYGDYILASILPSYHPKGFDNIAISDSVKDIKEGIRQVLLINKWFSKGNYSDLIDLEIKDRRLLIELKVWRDLVKTVGENITNYKALSIYYQQLIEFQEDSYFNLFSVKEHCKLLILLGGD